MKKSIQQAFPVTLAPGEVPLGEWNPDGMALRDYFAAKAMQELISVRYQNEGWDDLREMAEVAYIFADAMLEEREK